MTHRGVTHIMQIQNDPVGGIRKHVHSILFSIDRDIKQSYVYSTMNSDARFKEDLPKLTQCLTGEILPMKIYKKPHVSDIYNIMRLARYIKKSKVDILHGHGAKGGVYARILAKLCGIKAIYTPHGGSVHNMYSSFTDTIYTTVEKVLYNMTDFLLFESRYTAEAYHKKVKCVSDRWKVNYNGVNIVDINIVANKSISLGYHLSPKDVIHIGVFGVLRYQKGQKYAVKATKRLVDKGINVCLHLFGEGPDRENLIYLAASLGIDSHVLFHGEVEETSHHLYAMDIILIPSLFESFGYVAVEAASLRKAVVATAVGGLCEIIEDGKTGILVTAGDEEAMASSLFKIVNDKNLIQYLGNNAYERYEALFTESNMLSNILNIYREVSATK